MAKYNIKHTCGHMSEKNICGKESERPRLASYYATQICGKCWYAEQNDLTFDGTSYHKKKKCETIDGNPMPGLIGFEE